MTDSPAHLDAAPTGAEPQARDLATLADFLAQRDAPCPGCSYNLRGVATDKCPECGTPLQLELKRRRPLAGWGAFLLLVFGWLFLAGGLNTARSARDLIETRQQTALAQKRMAATRAQLQLQVKRMQDQLAAANQAQDAVDDGFPGSAQFKQMRQQMQKDMQAAMQQSLKAQIASMAPAPPPTVPTLAEIWAGSNWKIKFGSAWFASLTLAGALGLLLLLISRLRRWPESRVRVLAAAGFTLFALYAAWHITLFVSEFR